MSAPRSVALFLCLDKSLLLSPESERTLLDCFLSLSRQVPCSAFSRKLVCLPRLLSFRILTSPSLYCPQLASAPRLVAFCVLTSPFISPFQRVSTPRLVALLPCPDKSLCHHQFVSVSQSVTLFPCPDKSLPPPPPGSECPLLYDFHSVS